MCKSKIVFTVFLNRTKIISLIKYLEHHDIILFNILCCVFSSLFNCSQTAEWTMETCFEEILECLPHIFVQQQGVSVHFHLSTCKELRGNYSIFPHLFNFEYVKEYEKAKNSTVLSAFGWTFQLAIWGGETSRDYVNNSRSCIWKSSSWIQHHYL